MKKKKDKSNDNLKWIRSLSMSDIDKLNQKIKDFIFQEEHCAVQDTVELNIYDNGDLILTGEFQTHVSEKIII